jgi:dienelactone hydrolase
MTLQEQPVGYKDGDTPLTGLLVRNDERHERRPGVLVVHGGAGLDEHARGRARILAALGYVVFACDMYGDGVPGNRERIMACIGELRKDPARLRRRAQAGIDVLAAHPEVDGRIAAVGYCFGGMTVLEVARGGAPLSGVVSVHGSLEAMAPAAPGSIAAKILVCHGALDPHVPMSQVTGLVEEMNNAGADWQLLVYGRAVHGFTHETATGRETPGVAYDAAADARSRVAIESFLREAMG